MKKLPNFIKVPVSWVEQKNGKVIDEEGMQEDLEWQINDLKQRDDVVNMMATNRRRNKCIVLYVKQD